MKWLHTLHTWAGLRLLNFAGWLNAKAERHCEKHLDRSHYPQWMNAKVQYTLTPKGNELCK